MNATDRLVCAVMAGGSGTRFWPLSRSLRPKQLLALLTSESLLRGTVDRIAPLCSPERTLVITAERLAAATAADLPDVPAANIIAEPMPRNTAPCMALAAIAAQQLHPDAILALLPADHHVGDPAAFRAALKVATEQAADGHIVTLGIVPTRPETGYGYIEVGAPAGDAFEVRRFVEKPDLATAATYLAGGRHLWNGGIFVLRADVALAAMQAHAPQIHASLKPLHGGMAGRFDSDEFKSALAQNFERCPSISIDYAIAERAMGLRTVRLDAGWSDVGTWASLVAEGHAQGSSFVRGDVLDIENTGCVLVSDGPTIAAVGLEDIAIVATGDAVLAMPLSRSQDVRKVVSALQKAGRGDLL